MRFLKSLAIPEPAGPPSDTETPNARIRTLPSGEVPTSMVVRDRSMSLTGCDVFLAYSNDAIVHFLSFRIRRNDDFEDPSDAVRQHRLLTKASTLTSR